MREMQAEELEKILASRVEGERLILTNLMFSRMNFSDKDLHNIDFAGCMFSDVVFDGANLSQSDLENACLDGCSLRGKFVCGSFGKCESKRGKI